MNIKDFLIDNYIWIIIIILITIVTVIGFIADTKKSNKNKQETPTDNSSNNPETGQLQEQNLMNNPVNIDMQLNQNTGISNNPMTTPQPMNTELKPTELTNNVLPTVNQPIPVENVITNVEPEPIYQPLSEQKPVIPPQPIPNFNTSAQQQPMIQQEINQVQEQVNIPNGVVSTDSTSQPVLAEWPQQNAMNLGQHQGTTQNLISPMPSVSTQRVDMQSQTMTANINNNVNPMPNYGTTPQPVTPIPVPQPVMPQPIMTQEMPNQVQQIQQQNYALPQQMNQIPYPVPTQNMASTMPQPMMNSQMSSQVPNAPQQTMNFVFGNPNDNQNV